VKIKRSDHVAIAETRRGVIEDMIDNLAADTIGYWKAVGDRKYQDGLIVGLKIGSTYDRSSGTEKET